MLIKKFKILNWKINHKNKDNNIQLNLLFLGKINKDRHIIISLEILNK